MITETVLEMHFHKPLMDLFRDTFGLGLTGSINFYKYSPQRECFIGFDQAYAKTELSEEAFFELLRDAAMSSGYRVSDTFLGYFLQFKIVKEMQVRKRYAPPNMTNRPHYRVSLDTTKNINTGLSQHELLYNLNQNPGALVYYACPMIFDRAVLYEINVDLDLLRLADMDTCPSAYGDNDNHFVYFNDRQATPIWCSEPVDGKAIAPPQLARIVAGRLREVEPAQAAADLLNLLTDVDGVGLRADAETFREKSVLNLLPLIADSLTVIRIQQPATDDARA
ncbi:MAG: hypothetical protein ACJ76J_00420 [Thermoanaerobaculia bacterium]